MTNISLHINSLIELEKELKSKGVEKFCKKYKKYEILIGDSDSIKFIQDTIKQCKKDKI